MAEKIVGITPHKTNDLDLNELATVIFTVGGIDITTNLQPTRAFDLKSSSFTKLFTLSDLPPENTLFKEIKLNGDIELSFDKRNPKYYAKYGSLLELVRVSIETIVLTFPAALHSKADIRNVVGNNILSAGYYPLDNTTIFTANVSYFSNPFEIYYLDNYNFQYTDDRVNSIRNLTQNYLQYELIVDNIAYPILDFTPSNMSINDVVKFKVEGKPFDIGNSSKEFYIKPIESAKIDFYKTLSDFEAYLLNPETDYSAVFHDKKEVDGGVILNYKLKIQFPKLDDYNLDISTSSYDIYLNDLTSFAIKYDDVDGNILMRRLVPENVQSVTLENLDSTFPTFGKINKLLILYGREIDEINKHIENIKFFNSVTYNKRDNIPQYLIPLFAKNLGWTVETPEEIDDDLWRYLIINSWYIWKSKGTRKAIEFILDYLSIPREIIDYNEYVYRAKSPINVEELEFYYSLFDGEFDISTIPIDEEGFPEFPAETDEDYFQIVTEEEGKLLYFHKYLNLFPSYFTGTTVNYTQELITSNVLFEQDFDGTGNTLDYTIINDSSSINECYLNTGSTISDPYPEVFLDICGCPLPISDKSLEVCIEPVDLSGCTPIILDVFYECSDKINAVTYVKAYGGTEPYTITGLDLTYVESEGYYSGDTITGVTYQLQFQDVNGCYSDEYEFIIDCVDPCLGSDLAVELSYDCILDVYNQNTGEATVTIVISGGESPYVVTGVQDGDIVNHDEIITVNVTDSKGCTTGDVGLLVECEPPASVTCDPINLSATLETTNVETQNNTAKVNVTYDLLGLPSGLFIDTVTMISIGVGGDNSYVVGSPVSTVFTTPSGADTIDLDFNPTIIQTTIAIEVTLDVLLSNGCSYTDTYSMSVDPRQLGNADFYNSILA